MRVLLDECVDWRLSRDITGHEVKTAHQMGWAAIKNSELLARAAEYFDVFVTVDRNLGSGLIDYIQKMTIAAIQIADMNVWAHRS